MSDDDSAPFVIPGVVAVPLCFASSSTRTAPYHRLLRPLLKCNTRILLRDRAPSLSQSTIVLQQRAAIRHRWSISLHSTSPTRTSIGAFEKGAKENACYLSLHSALNRRFASQQHRGHFFFRESSGLNSRTAVVVVGTVSSGLCAGLIGFEF